MRYATDRPAPQTINISFQSITSEKVSYRLRVGVTADGARLWNAPARFDQGITPFAFRPLCSAGAS